MKAGRLRHRVTLQSLATGSPQKTEMGSADQAWADVVTVWADIRPLQGTKLFNAQQVQSDVTTEIEIRYRAGVTAKMRAKHGTNLYDIEAVIQPDARPIRLVLHCSIGVNDG